MISNKVDFDAKIKGLVFYGVLGVLHLFFAVWLIYTAFRVLEKPLIFPWWIMDINIFASGILLIVGISSLMIFINFILFANIHRILAFVNITLMIVFFLYLSQFLILGEFSYYVFEKPYQNYDFGFETLIFFTSILSIPSILTLFIDSSGKKNTGLLLTTSFILIVVLASVGVYYLYLDDRKDAMIVEEFGENGEYKLYRFEPEIPPGSPALNTPYLIDSRGDTTGHQISEDMYEAIKFLQGEDEGNVMAWWDFELEIKAAGKVPVISYASEAIITTVARPAALYDTYEPNGKVADVARFFTTGSEDEAQTIAEKYGAGYVYYPRNRNYLFPVMLLAADPDYMKKQNTQNPEEYLDSLYSRSMGNKFENGAELQHFDKIFENDGVFIYQLK